MFASKLEWWHFHINNNCRQRCFLTGKFRKINLAAVKNMKLASYLKHHEFQKNVSPAYSNDNLT
jgi:hypothetical protein